jgi:hypothetical protein
VTAIANALHNVTRKAALSRCAPPALAAIAPKTKRLIRDAATVRGITYDSLDNHATSRGMTAPIAKLPAEATAACRGRATERAENPS